MKSKFIVFVDEQIRVMRSQGKIGTSNTYLAVSRSVMAFSGKCSLPLRAVFNKDFLHRYQAYLLDRECCYNTISSYMRVLRAIRNKAVKLGLLSLEADLFNKLYTGSEPTRKRALRDDVILDLNGVDLSDCPHLVMSRELFMLLFHLQGMSFVDLAHLRKSDLKGDYITYRRRKTDGLISVRIWEPARELLDRYLSTDKHSPYLLSILDSSAQYRSVLRRFNRHLKSLAELLGIREPLTSYVARHSWATAAYHAGTPVALISEAMGHKTEEVTRIYLDSFDTETMDNVNRIAWESLLRNRTTGKKAGKRNSKDPWRRIRDVSFLGRERHPLKNGWTRGR